MREPTISNEETYALAQKAFEKGEFKFFLEGSNGYVCPVDRFCPACLPTDFECILMVGIYELYKNTKDEKIITDLKKAILELLDGSAVQIWVAYYICWYLYYKEQKNKASFKVLDDEILKKLKESVNSHEKELKSNKEWQGMSRKDGLWGDIVGTSGGKFELKAFTSVMVAK